jgi:molybdenum cofactor cytidylyltransferase
MDTECVILAAGYSSRAKTNKMLLPLQNKTVLEKCIETFYDDTDRIIVVGGYRFSEITPITLKYEKVKPVYNKNYPEGMFGSVKEGLKQTRGGRIFITPGDYPLIKASTVKTMLGLSGNIIIPRYFKEPGHPVLISRRCISDICGGGYSSLRDFITLNKKTTVEVDDAGILTDIDTMADYHFIINKWRC